MKLTSIFPQIKTDGKIQAKRPESPSAARQEAADASVGSDRVDLSASSMDVQKAQEVLQQAPSVRAEKVRALKEQVESGEYRVDPHKIADKMMLSLISDNLVND